MPLLVVLLLLVMLLLVARFSLDLDGLFLNDLAASNLFGNSDLLGDFFRDLLANLYLVGEEFHWMVKSLFVL